MRLAAAWMGLVCALPVGAQTGGDRELREAEARVETLRQQVAAGVTPRAGLERAEAALADAQDAALLQRTLYGSADLSEEESTQMLAASQRRVERRKTERQEARRTVDEGGAPRLSLGLPLENLDMARRELDLAESRVRLVRELAAMVRAEQEQASKAEEERSPAPLFDRFEGSGLLTPGDIYRLESAFAARFDKPLPVSARGETAVHRALGFDHRHRLDVAVHPDDPEGIWLRQFLVDANLPFFSFRTFVPGKATGAHIHIGPQSGRVARGG
ncbi:MAG: hypothetical protein HYR60_06860 [Acidobacteria bacterium]|nr:hypothetical protein [Acidobacteriota bacterium]